MTALNNLYTAAQIREMEQRQIHERNTPGYTLMLRAGQALFAACASKLSSGDKTTVLTGPGNNGGDGYVVAKLLAEAGHTVEVISLTDPAKLTGDAATARDDWSTIGPIKSYDGTLPPKTTLIVDALLGTGLERDLKDSFALAVEQINAHSASVIAVDIPSGLSSETGQPLGLAVEAEITVTFIGLKLGLYTGKGPHYSGEVILDTLETDADILDTKPTAQLAGTSELKKRLPPRAFDTHKGHCGHTLLIGGDRGMPGAISMAGEAAARSGSGLISIATHVDHAALIPMTHPELMSHGIENLSQAQRLIHQADVIAIGPGLGQTAWSRKLWETALEARKPMVVDADALNLLSMQPSTRDNWVLTPHPGEAARLLDTTVKELESDRPAAANELQNRYGGVAVLKGAGTLVCDGESIYLCTTGNPGMASGGMGDVLTGTIAGLLAQFGDSFSAAVAGVIAHGHAADLAAGKCYRGLLARDVLDQLRTAVNPEP